MALAGAPSGSDSDSCWKSRKRSCSAGLAATLTIVSISYQNGAPSVSKAAICWPSSTGTKRIAERKAELQGRTAQGGTRTLHVIAHRNHLRTHGRSRGAQVHESAPVNRGVGVEAGAIRGLEEPRQQIRVGDLAPEILLHQREAAGHHRRGERCAASCCDGPDRVRRLHPDRNRTPELHPRALPGNSPPQCRSGWRSRRSRRPGVWPRRRPYSHAAPGSARP